MISGKGHESLDLGEPFGKKVAADLQGKSAFQTSSSKIICHSQGCNIVSKALETICSECPDTEDLPCLKIVMLAPAVGDRAGLRESLKKCEGRVDVEIMYIRASSDIVSTYYPPDKIPDKNLVDSFWVLGGHSAISIINASESAPERNSFPDRDEGEKEFEWSNERVSDRIRNFLSTGCTP